jgi:hypothetical protein
MPKTELKEEQDQERDLEKIASGSSRRDSSTKFKFNREGIIRKRHSDIKEKYIYG